MTPINNQYTQYRLTPDQQIIGFSLSPEQRAVIQNDIAEAAIKRANLVLDTANPNKFIQEDAALKGQITILSYMLVRADNVIELAASRTYDNQDSQE